jgi:magnesium chelatase family protein
MLAKLKTFTLVGIDAIPVEVEVDVSPAGLPKTVIVGSLFQKMEQGC